MTVLDPDSLVFQTEKPRPDPRGSKYAAVRERLREHPGQWARVAENTTHESARRQMYRNKGFEALVRGASRNNPRGDMWMRYVGENGEYA